MNVNLQQPTTVIVGGGVIGLSIAWRLAQAGERVTLIERGRVGEEASGAAAGMLAPFAEARERGAFSELGLASLRLYPDFVEELKAETCLDCELVRTGLLRVAEEDGQAELRATYAAMRDMGSNAEWVECAGLRRMEPALSGAVTAAIYSPTEWQLEPRRLVRALAVAAAKRGVTMVENAPVVGFETDGGVVTGVRTASASYPAVKVVIAGGSWNTAIASQLGASIPVKPIRGQIVALGPCYPMPLLHTIYSHHGYLVPKTDGRVIVGATEEDTGFDKRTTASGVAGLLKRAIELAPCLADAPIQATWSGLRPMSADRLPVLGRLGAWQNAFVAAGHFRNGILMTPITAKLMAELVLGGSPAIDSAFSPDRFTQ